MGVSPSRSRDCSLLVLRSTRRMVARCPLDNPIEFPVYVRRGGQINRPQSARLLHNAELHPESL
jgi:hypothetical protein